MVRANKKENEEDNCDAEPRWKCPPAKNVTHPLRYYEFTQEEMKALEECDKESFYQRCLPFSTLLATLTYGGVKNGLLRRSPHFGAAPKVTLAALVGHFCGRLSYLPECDSKLRRLPPNSHLGNTMRQYYLENNPPTDPKKSR
ncbi:unnamed protein product [Euphydryas editha]|uniref:OCIA domain-containing protein n=1 Tax=Euphydryas editha TaxID=104508 RepID=A0AAU9UZY5_EUPED|nr:unnamed protein product [Euphydryas editha]